MERTYVVLMRRWGNLEGHTYIAGVYETQETATEAAEGEVNSRGGKYLYQIFECLHHNTKLVADTCGDQTHHDMDLLASANAQLDALCKSSLSSKPVQP